MKGENIKPRFLGIKRTEVEKFEKYCFWLLIEISIVSIKYYFSVKILWKSLLFLGSIKWEDYITIIGTSVLITLKNWFTRNNYSMPLLNLVNEKLCKAWYWCQLCNFEVHNCQLWQEHHRNSLLGLSVLKSFLVELMVGE